MSRLFEGETINRLVRHHASVVDSVTYDGLLAAIGDLLHKARASIARKVNDVLVQTYWQTGRYIVVANEWLPQRARFYRHLYPDGDMQFAIVL